MHDILFQLGERWLNVFIIDLARYLVGAGVVWFTLFIIFRSFSQTRVIQRRRPSARDLQREITHSIKTVMVYATAALVTVEMIQRGWTRLYLDPVAHGYVYLVLSVPLLLILHDTYFYWIHRWMHSPLLFGPVHQLHHRSRTPTPWAAYSFSIGEAFLMTSFVPLVLLILPVHPTALFVFLAIMIVRNAMGHSGIEFHPRAWVDSPLDILTTVTHHDLHHQRFRGNYGLYFTWWDRLMGTEIEDYKTVFRQVTGSDHTNKEGGLS